MSTALVLSSKAEDLLFNVPHWAIFDKFSANAITICTTYYPSFINDDSEEELFISDFRELGYEYLLYKGENLIRCADCGILTRGNKTGTKKYCKDCATYTPQGSKTVVCVDCGKEFEVDAKDNQTCRCKDCYIKYRKEYKAKNERERRKKLKENS